MPYSNEINVAMVTYCHLYSHQYVEYLVVDLVRNQPKTRENILIFFLPRLGNEPRTSLPLSLQPCHLSHQTSRKKFVSGLKIEMEFWKWWIDYGRSVLRIWWSSKWWWCWYLAVFHNWSCFKPNKTSLECCIFVVKLE